MGSITARSRFAFLNARSPLRPPVSQVQTLAIRCTGRWIRSSSDAVWKTFIDLNKRPYEDHQC